MLKRIVLKRVVLRQVVLKRCDTRFSTCKMACAETGIFDDISAQVILHVLKRSGAEMRAYHVWLSSYKVLKSHKTMHIIQ